LIVLCLALSLCACSKPTDPTTPVAQKNSPGEEHAKETPGEAHAKDPHGHEEGAEGEIELKAEQVALVGIMAEKLTTRDFTSSSKLPATIVGDPDREIKVSTRVEGIVDQLYVRVGDFVRRGQVLATISSPEVARLRAEYHTQHTATQLAQENLQRRLKLNRIGDVVRRPYEEAQREVAQARLQISAAQANLDLNTTKRTRLEALLKDGIASQQQVDEARAIHRESVARLEQARLEQQVARTHLGRELRLKNTGLLADNEAFEAQVELKRSQQAETVARQVLISLGAAPDLISGELDLISPRDGFVIERPKAKGERVAAGDTLLTVLDPDHVWAWVDLPPELVHVITLNTVVQVSVQSLPKRSFEGKLTFITPEVDPDTKKTRARLELDNHQRLLRPNMFAEVILPVGRRRKALSLPQEAVVTVENQTVVYLQEGPGHYERHQVVIGEKSAGWVEIVSGLEAGQLVVTRGVLALQAEDLKAGMGEAGHQH
jgi:RND family efflux transporter MFP subunit